MVDVNDDGRNVVAHSTAGIKIHIGLAISYIALFIGVVSGRSHRALLARKTSVNNNVKC